MANYKVKWRYASSIGGAWQKGDIVDIDEKLAAAINIDSPGVLEPIAERQQAPKQDRQLKKPDNERKE